MINGHFDGRDEIWIGFGAVIGAAANVTVSSSRSEMTANDEHIFETASETVAAAVNELAHQSSVSTLSN